MSLRLLLVASFFLVCAWTLSAGDDAGAPEPLEMSEFPPSPSLRQCPQRQQRHRHRRYLQAPENHRRSSIRAQRRAKLRGHAIERPIAGS